MHLGCREKNRRYVNALLTRLEQASDSTALFLEKKDYKVDEPVLFVVFMACDEDQRPLALLEIDEVLTCIEEGDFAGVPGITLGLIGGNIETVDETVVTASGWAKGSNRPQYCFRIDASKTFHDYDDKQLYRWGTIGAGEADAGLAEVEYALWLTLTHSVSLNPFMHNIIDGLTHVCGWGEEEEAELLRRLITIEKNLKGITKSVRH